MKKGLIPTVLLLLSLFLIMASLYQLEIIFIWIHLGRHTFEFPFYLLTMNIYVARDFFYLLLLIGWIMAVLGGYYAKKYRVFQRILGLSED